MEGKKTTVLLAFLSGVIVGGIAALLLAPASGSEVRKKIKEEVDEALEKVRAEAETLKEITSKAKEIIETKKEELKEAIEKSKETLKEKKEELASKLLKKEEV